MKTIYLIVSIIVIVLFFILLGKKENQNIQPDSTRPEITNYVPSVIRDSTALEHQRSTETKKQANTEKPGTRSEVLENQNYSAHTKLDTLHHIKESLTDTFDNSVNQRAELSQSTSGQDREKNQTERNKILLEIKQLLKNNQ